MSIYTSQGTIRVRYRFDATNGNISKTMIYFVPERDYSIKHKNKHYAVFVPLSGRNCIMKRYNPNKGRGVKLDANGTNFTVDISSAHTHQTKVQVVVKSTIKLKAAEATEVKNKATNAEDKAVAAEQAAAEDKENAEAAMNQAIDALMKEVNKLKQCFKLTDITIPAT